MTVSTMKRCSLSPREIRRHTRDYRNTVKNDRTQTWEPYWRIVRIRLPKRKGMKSFDQVLLGMGFNGKRQ